MLLDGDVLSLATGAVESMGQTRLHLAGVSVAAPTNGVPIAAFPVHSLTIHGQIRIESGGPNSAVAFLSDGLIEIDGTISLASASALEAPPGAFVGPGLCAGTAGVLDTTFGTYRSGGGGGGGATAGGDGGTLDPVAAPAGRGGSAVSNQSVQPLRGGCDGAGNLSFGGGAIQMTSRLRIAFGAGARILANGTDEQPTSESVGGGGAGGAVLIEAPSVSIDPTAILSANGSGGTAGDGTRASTPQDGSPSSGGTCALPAGCSRGGEHGHARRGVAGTS